MRAQNLTISVPPGDMLCDKNCPYCVSRMTGYVKTDFHLMHRNIEKVQTLARSAQVTGVLFTGKGEPTLNRPGLMELLEAFNYYPCELQTNGIKLSTDHQYIYDLADYGMNVIAVSIDHLSQFVSYYDMFAKIKEEGMLTRVTINVTDRIPKDTKFDDLIAMCRESHVDQMMLRQIVIPNYVDPNSKTAQWITMNVDDAQYSRLFAEMRAGVHLHGRFLRQLHFGPEVWEYNGVSVSYSDYCIQDSNMGEDIRSLIFLEDGHLYTSWNSAASAIF
jgi:organic radical activating enzyme